MASVSSSNNQSFGTLHSCYSHYSQRSGASSRTAGGVGTWREQQLGSYNSRRQSLQPSIAASETFLVDARLPEEKAHEGLPISRDTFEPGIAVFYERSSRTAFKRTATELAKKYGSDIIGFPIDVRAILKRATSAPSNSGDSKSRSRRRKGTSSQRRYRSTEPATVQDSVRDAMRPMENHYNAQVLFLMERVMRRKVVSEEIAARTSLSMECRYTVPLHDKLVMWWVKNVLAQERSRLQSDVHEVSRHNISGTSVVQSRDGFMSPRSAMGISNTDVVESGTPVSARQEERPPHSARNLPEVRRNSIISNESALDTSHDVTSPEGMYGKHYVKIGKYTVRANSAGKSAMEQQLHANSFVSPDLTLVSQSTTSPSSHSQASRDCDVRDTRSETQPHLHVGIRKHHTILPDVSTLSTMAGSAIGTGHSPHTITGSPSDAANMTVLNTTIGGAQDATMMKIASSTSEHSAMDVVNSSTTHTTSEVLRLTPKSHVSTKLQHSPGSPSPLQPNLELSMTQKGYTLPNSNTYERKTNETSSAMLEVVQETQTIRHVPAMALPPRPTAAASKVNIERNDDDDDDDEDNEEFTRTVASLHSTIRGLLTGDIPSATQQFRQNQSLFQSFRRTGERNSGPHTQYQIPQYISGESNNSRRRSQLRIPQYIARPQNNDSDNNNNTTSNNNNTGVSLKDTVLAHYAKRREQ